MPRHPTKGWRNGNDPLKEARGENLPYWFVAGYGVEQTLPQPGLDNLSKRP